MAQHLSILFVTGEYPPMVGGVGDYTRRLAQALAERDHMVHVLTKHGLITLDRPPTTDHQRPIPSWWQDVKSAIVATKPDVVHIQYQTGAYDMRPAINLVPSRLRRLAQRPHIIVTAHDLRLPYLFPKADPLRTWLTSRLFNAADALIVTNADDELRVLALSEADRNLYSPRTPVNVPIHIIPIGSNIAPQPPTNYNRDAWRQALSVKPDDVLIGYFGLLNRTKGVLPLLEALAALPPHFRLLIIGGAAPQPDDQRYAAEIHAYITTQHLSERVTITGPCAEPDVSAHLLAADLAALPFLDGASYRRGSLLAALAHGLATITTTPSRLLNPPLEDGVHALLASAEATALRSSIERLAMDAALKHRLSIGGRSLAAHFDWSRIAAQHETVYHMQ